MNPQQRRRVVIVGGGFGGLHAARALKRMDVDVTVVDRRNFHLFQPLLYQVATGSLSPANIASPIRAILRRQKNCQVVLGEVVAIDPKSRTIECESPEPGESRPHREIIGYDWLVVAAGAVSSFFGHDEWESTAPGLKTIEDATRIRGKIFSAFEAAEFETDPDRRTELMTFVIVGGGPTGVELAGAIAELARRTLKDDFRNINPPDAKIILVDGQDRVLSGFVPELSAKAESSLAKLGVELKLHTTVTKINSNSVELKTGEDHFSIRSRTVLWAAGVSGVPFGKKLAAAVGVETKHGGRLPVNPDLSIDDHPEIYVIGDLAFVVDENGEPLPGVAPVAMQQGTYVGKLIASAINGNSNRAPFKYRDKGSLATIGRSKAVADLGKLKFSGFFAWALWLLVHIMFIVQFQNRILVFFQWAWNYITFNRSARLITEPDHLKNQR